MTETEAGVADVIAAAAADLDAEVAIRSLMVSYMRACDDHDANAVAELFHDEAVWESARSGDRLVGRGAIRAAYAADCARLTFCVHYLTNEWIHIDATRAKARWCYFEPAVNRGELAVWTAGRYDLELARHGDRWGFTSFYISPVLAAPQQDGWGTVPVVALP